MVAYGANASASALARRKKAFQSTSAPIFLEPVVSAKLPGHWGSLDSGNTSGYGEIHAIETDETTGESVGVATNGTARQYPWGVERFEEAIEHRTSDAKPSNTSVTGATHASIGTIQPCTLKCTTAYVVASTVSGELHFLYPSLLTAQAATR